MRMNFQRWELLISKPGLWIFLPWILMWCNIRYQQLLADLCKILVASSRLMSTPMLCRECWISAASIWPANIHQSSIVREKQKSEHGKQFKMISIWKFWSNNASNYYFNCVLLASTDRHCSCQDYETWVWALFHGCGDTAWTLRSLVPHLCWCPRPPPSENTDSQVNEKQMSGHLADIWSETETAKR